MCANLFSVMSIDRCQNFCSVTGVDHFPLTDSGKSIISVSGYCLSEINGTKIGL